MALMSTPGMAHRPVMAPLLAALVAAVLTVLGVLAWGAFERVPCEGFGCLGPALIAVVTIPTAATLLGWLLLRAFGVPRPFLVAALTLASAWLLGGTVSLPEQIETVYWALPALCAAAWTWALTPGRANRALALAGGLAAVGLAGFLWQQWSSERDAEARLDATDAPQLILDDERWDLISTDVTQDSFGTLYETSDGVRLSVTAAEEPADADPADCAEVTAAVLDQPGETCTDLGTGVWEVRTGSVTTHVGFRDGALIGFDPLYPDALQADEVSDLLAGVRATSGAELRDLLRD